MTNRNKIRILFICCFLYGLVGVPIKAPLSTSTEKMFFSAVFSVSAFLIVIVLILNYKKLLSYWHPKNKQQEMTFLKHFTFSVGFLMTIASYGLVWIL
ncbi:hypothetical protein SAMN02746068_01257 [Lactococcus chungangensis CAU 28 = DSM 22330]|uniref:Uncharacterized protein n=1 Tax=Pseudolactococcus chungangensis CAU 28 = DSM 22330 TaxID=1122154 RepID=A0A1K2HCR4_9LACT|nr:hypothetical protein [Lactococcus chungangensis]SFZ74453.1 hypothetical protein SAMN02746068_01257 [Lactococcus chungangensis CAU 28 = DSM 22330]